MSALTNVIQVTLKWVPRWKTRLISFLLHRVFAFLLLFYVNTRQTDMFDRCTRAQVRTSEILFGLALCRVSGQCLRVLGHLLWLTGKCVQLNWSSILLDRFKKVNIPRQPSREALLVRRPKSVKTIESTGKRYKYCFLFIFLILISLLF